MRGWVGLLGGGHGAAMGGIGTKASAFRIRRNGIVCVVFGIVLVFLSNNRFLIESQVDYVRSRKMHMFIKIRFVDVEKLSLDA